MEICKININNHLLPIFPSKAECFEIVEFERTILSYSWLLGDDASRPNKRSRHFNVIFTDEANMDLRDMGCDDAAKLIDGLRDYIENIYKTFTPTHSCKYGESPKAENVTILPSNLLAN